MDSSSAYASCCKVQRCERGQGLAEYVIIVVVVVVAVILAIRYFSGGVGNQFKEANQTINQAGSDQSGSSGSGRGGGRDSAPSDAGGGYDDEAAGSPEEEEVAAGSRVKGFDEAPDLKGEDLNQLAESVSTGVGDPSAADIPPVRISWWALLTIGLGVLCMGMYLVMRFSRQVDKQFGKKTGKRRRRLKLDPKPKGDESGQAMVEFVLCVITYLFCILGVIQLALVLNAITLVRYAAYNAARAGIVHGADMVKMQDAARISLLPIFPRHGRADHLRGITENYIGATLTDQDENLTYYDEKITEVSLVNSNTGFAAGGVATFDDPVDARNAIITVQVVHQYELVIPLVNRIAFFLYTQIRDNGEIGDEDVDQAAAITDRLRRTGDFQDIEYRLPLVAHYTMRMQSDYAPQ